MVVQNPAVERIAFQHHSRLATRMVEACQAFLDYVIETRPANKSNGLPPVADEARVYQIVKYARNTFSPQLVKIFAEEIKLDLVIECYPDVIFNCMMAPIFRNLNFREDAEALYTGMASYSKKPIDLDLFAENKDELKLDISQFAKKPDLYLMGLFLFPVTFLGIEVFGGDEPWTAEEHAAVILHECGHALSIFEHSLDFYHRVNIAGNSIKYLNEKAGRTDIIAAVEAVAKKAPAQHNPKEWTDFFDKTKKEIETVKVDKHGLGPIAAVLLTRVAALVLLYLLTAVFAFFYRILHKGMFGRINESTHKSSDTVVTFSNAGYDERIADEFASRHGLALALASALKKMSNSSYLRSPVSDALHNTLVVKSIVNAFSAILHTFGMVCYMDNGTYDPDWLRYENLLQNNMVVFKDTSLSPELRDHYLKETTELLKLVTEFKSTNRFKISQLFWGTILRITSRTSSLDAFSTAGLSADYDTLQQLTSGLIKNKLAFYAARIKKL